MWACLIDPEFEDFRKEDRKEFSDKISKEVITKHYNVLLHYGNEIIECWKTKKNDEAEKNLENFPDIAAGENVFELKLWAFDSIMLMIRDKLKEMEEVLDELGGNNFKIKVDVQVMKRLGKALDFLEIFQREKLDDQNPEDIKNAIIQYRKERNHKKSI